MGLMVRAALPSPTPFLRAWCSWEPRRRPVLSQWPVTQSRGTSGQWMSVPSPAGNLWLAARHRSPVSLPMQPTGMYTRRRMGATPSTAIRSPLAHGCRWLRARSTRAITAEPRLLTESSIRCTPTTAPTSESMTRLGTHGLSFRMVWARERVPLEQTARTCMPVHRVPLRAMTQPATRGFRWNRRHVPGCRCIGFLCAL
jgi:hypothetical protein